MKKLPAQPVQGLIDGLAVLQELSSRRGETSCTDLSRCLDMELTRVNRILKTLDYLGLARRTKNRRYCPGPGMHVLAIQSLLGSGLLSLSLPELRSLRRFGHTVALGVLWRDTVSYLYHHNKGMSDDEALGRLSLFPATRSSVGMALLADKPWEEVAQLYDGATEIPGFPKGLTSLEKTLAETRERGWGSVTGEDGIVSLAVTIGSPAFAAIALSGKIAPDDIARHVAELRSVAERIEAGLER